MLQTSCVISGKKRAFPERDSGFLCYGSLSSGDSSFLCCLCQKGNCGSLVFCGASGRCLKFDYSVRRSHLGQQLRADRPLLLIGVIFFKFKTSVGIGNLGDSSVVSLQSNLLNFDGHPTGWNKHYVPSLLLRCNVFEAE